MVDCPRCKSRCLAGGYYPQFIRISTCLPSCIRVHSTDGYISRCKAGRSILTSARAAGRPQITAASRRVIPHGNCEAASLARIPYTSEALDRRGNQRCNQQAPRTASHVSRDLIAAPACPYRLGAARSHRGPTPPLANRAREGAAGFP